MKVGPEIWTQEALGAAVAAVPHWFHSHDLGQGIVTPGDKSLSLLQGQWAALQLPDLRGKTVLDIGAWDGFFSFAAEASGVRVVVALPGDVGPAFEGLVNRQRRAPFRSPRRPRAPRVAV